MEINEKTGVSLLVKGSVRKQRATIVVQAFDRDMRHAESLGRATVARDGTFEIEYSREQFRRAEKERADLFIRVLDHKGRELYESETRFNAKDVEVFNVELSRDAFCDADEWSWMCEQISAPIENISVAKLTDEDLVFLHKETGFSVERLRLFRTDASWACAHKLPEAFFYAMFRHGLPTLLPRLLALSPDRWREAVKASIAADIVPESLAKCLEDALEKLEELADDVALSGQDDEGGMPAVATLAVAPLSKSQRRVFARALRRNPSSEKLWYTLAADPGFGAKAVADARFVLDAEPLVANHLPTLRALEKHRQEHGFQEVVDLARLTRADIQEIAKTGAGDGLPKGFESADEFAAHIAHGIEQVFPSAVIARRFETGPSSRADVARFLLDNSDFDVLTTSVSKALTTGTIGNIAEPKKLAQRLSAVARTARIVASDDVAKVPAGGLAAGIDALLENGFDSARKIASTPKPAFVALMTPIVGEAPAAAMYQVAGGRLDRADMMHNEIRDLVRDQFGPTGPVINIDISAPPEDWAFLFEGLGTCACKHCRSMLSPSAYLADLLKVIEDSPNAPWSALVSRRPDIAKLKLSCANANTPLPHIDLVNEILGDILIRRPVAARATIGDAEERRAAPDPLLRDSAVDARLAGTDFPWHLPFDSDHDELIAWAEHLGLSLDALVSTLKPATHDELVALAAYLGVPIADLVVLTPPATGDATRLALGLSPREWRVLTREEVRVAPSTPPKVVEYLKSTRLSYEELVALTETWTFSAAGVGALAIDDKGEPCDLSKHEVVATGVVFDAVERYVRIARRLRSALGKEGELDGALSALGAKRFTSELLRELVSLRSLAVRLRRTMPEVGLPSIALHDLLRVSALEVTLLETLTSSVSSSPRLACVTACLAIREAGLSIRQVANVVLGWDQTPAAFFPESSEATAFLRSMRTSFGGDVEARLALIASDAHAQAAFAASGAADSSVFYRRFYGEEVIAIAIADALNLSRESANALLGVGVDSAAVRANDGVRASIEDFLDVAAAADAALDLEPASETLRRLARAGRYVTALDLAGREISEFETLAPLAGLFSLNLAARDDAAPNAATSFASFIKALRLARLLKSMPTDLVIGTMANATALYDGRDFSNADTFVALEGASGWSRDEIRDTLSALGVTTTGAMQRVETYERLEHVIRTARRLSTSPSMVVGWTGPTDTSAHAAELRAIARARTSSTSEWYELLTPVSDRARERRRDCLLALVLQARGLSSADELYAQLLLDPQMAACAQTSRVKAAVSAVQLFVQRLLLGVESVRLDESARDHWKQWEWMKNYRVWEANRKVFLYPENWVYSELRDNKSELFVSLEDELLESDISTETASRALHNYVESFDRIARLDVRAVYFDAEADGGEPGSDATGVLHLFARTRSKPHTYFHRRRLPSRAFTPWEKIDLGIEGNHLAPFMSDGRLILLWVTFRAVKHEEATGSQDKTTWVAEIKWAEKHEQGWGPEQVAPNNHGSFGQVGSPPEQVVLRVREQAESVVIDIFTADEQSGIGAKPSVAFSFQSLEFVRCSKRLERRSVVRGEGERPVFNVAFLCPGTAMQGMHLGESLDDQTALRLIDFDGDDQALGLNIEALFEQLGGGLGAILVGLFIAAAQAIGEEAAIGLVRDTIADIEVLRSPPDGFRVLPSHQRRHADGQLPFVADLGERTYLVTPGARNVRIKGGMSGLGVYARDLSPYKRERAFYFEHLYHPYSCRIVEALSREGVDGLLAPPSSAAIDRQKLTELEPLFPTFTPIRVLEPYPVEEFEFEEHQALSVYNWELFFHVPLLIAERLTQNRRYDAARTWLHYIFDPTDMSGNTGLRRFWRTNPFFDDATGTIETIDDVLERIAARNSDDEARVAAWREDPFNPHRLARQRRSAYMRAVVMKYLDNLIAWGDDLFARDTMESIGEAAQLFVMANEIVGARRIATTPPETEAKSYEELGDLDALANRLEDELPASSSDGSGGGMPRMSFYFCVPANEKLNEYRDTIADRLAKIRNCRDLEGRFRDLPLYEPPIDPGLLVRARAAGLDIADALALTTNVALPHHRFVVLHGKAMELTSDVRALGNALASALERKDGEELSQLRSSHETTLLSRVSEIKTKQVEESVEALRALEESLRSTTERQAKLEEWADEYQNPQEKAQVGHLHTGRAFEIVAQAHENAAAIAHLFPNVTLGAPPSATFGGANIGNSLAAIAGGFKAIAGQFAFEASMSSIEGAHNRRRDEWQHQAKLAAIEVKQLEHQILAAEIRLAMAEADERNHRVQLSQAKEVEAFLRSKFSSRELYTWMVGQLSKLHRDAYRMAREFSVRAERAAQHELGLTRDEFRYVGFDHLDGAYKNLLAGDKLHQDLRRLDVAYAERNQRELEMTKHISLAQLAPLQLVKLRETGRCEFSIPEWLFDIEFPGHYRRRIRSVSVTIPAVTGPTTNVGAVLTLKNSSIRPAADLSVAPEPGFAAQRSIATSTANRDAGVFELNFRDERYLPFEGAGAVSEWSLELPAAIPTFDYETISDVLLHMSYTAADEPTQAAGTHPFRDAVTSQIEARVESWLSAGFSRVFSLRREFSSEFHQLTHPQEGDLGATTLDLASRNFPPLLRSFADRLRVVQVVVVAKLKAPGGRRVAFVPAEQVATMTELVSTAAWGGLPHVGFPASGSMGESPFQSWQLQLDGAGEAVDDVYIALMLQIA